VRTRQEKYEHKTRCRQTEGDQSKQRASREQSGGKADGKERQVQSKSKGEGEGQRARRRRGERAVAEARSKQEENREQAGGKQGASRGQAGSKQGASREQAEGKQRASRGQAWSLLAFGRWSKHRFPESQGGAFFLMHESVDVASGIVR
jgi:hypothetical protein